MKISVITVCHNAAATIQNTLLSVREQSHGDVEHIVMDGGSTDGTQAEIERHADQIAFWVSEPDKGIYDAMNKGIQKATGEVVGFLNADDVYVDRLVLQKMAAVFTNPVIDACYGDLVYVAPDNSSRVVRYWKSCPYTDGLFKKGWCPPHPTFFVRRVIYEKLGGFDLSYSMGNDVEIMMRFLANHKIKSLYLPEILVKMRTGGVSNKKLTNIIKQNLEILKAARRNSIAISPISFFFAKFSSRLLQYLSKAPLEKCP